MRTLLTVACAVLAAFAGQNAEQPKKPAAKPAPKTAAPAAKPKVEKPAPKETTKKEAPKTDGEKKPAVTTAGHKEDFPPDAQAIVDMAQDFAKAYNAHDAKAIAAQFLPDGEEVDDQGDVIHGRDEIEAQYAALFKDNPDASVQIQVTSIRFLGDDLLVEDGVTRMKASPDAAAKNSRYTAVHRKQGDKWLVASARDLDLALDEDATAHEELKAVEWLVGEWVDEREDSKVSLNCRWSDDGQYLLNDFTIEAPGFISIKGTQRIGWDAGENKIRSWTHDTEGGFATGEWATDGERWVVKGTGTRRDGIQVTATMHYIPVDKETYDVEFRDRVAGASLLPDAKITVVRKPPEPEVAADAK